ncbi:hypothetical protein ES703_32931 [subsurface metagenome]
MKSRHNIKRSRGRQPFVKEHRRFVLDHAIGRLLDGETTPDYVSARAKKLKEVA